MPRQKEPLRPTPTGRIFWPSTLPAGVDSAPTHRSVRRCRRAPSSQCGNPVVRGSKVTHVLVAELDLTWYDRLLNQPGQPAGAIAGIFDRNFNFVARSTEGDARRGQSPSPALVADMKRRPEGLARYTNLNGTAVYTAWTFTRHGWGVGFATPSAPVDNAFWHHLFLFGFLWAGAVGAGTLYAFSKARPIAASLESLEGQAEHIATGRRIESLPDSRVEEVNRVLMALEKASGLLQSTMRERDRSLETEREARAVAETELTAPRTSSWPCWATSCGIRWRQSRARRRS